MGPTVRPLREALLGVPDELVLFWHGAGNHEERLEAVLAQPEERFGRRLRHAVECDLKWDLDDEEPLLFLHHGSTGLSRPAAPAVRDRGVMTPERLFGRRGAERLDYMVEIKTGRGPRRRAIARFLEIVRTRGLDDRVMVAASSLPLVRELRREHPGLLLGLFVVDALEGGRVLNVPFVDLPRSLGAAGRLGRADLGGVDLVIGAGPIWQPPSAHVAQLQRARREGLVMIPGPVRAMKGLSSLATAGAQSAFLYLSADERL